MAMDNYLEAYESIMEAIRWGDISASWVVLWPVFDEVHDRPRFNRLSKS
jgi:hypothetical protein